jgi:hypothetical protein
MPMALLNRESRAARAQAFDAVQYLDVWPATERSSRYAGEAVHDVFLDPVIELELQPSGLGLVQIVGILMASSLCGAAACLLWQLS